MNFKKPKLKLLVGTNIIAVALIVILTAVIVTAPFTSYNLYLDAFPHSATYTIETDGSGNYRAISYTGQALWDSTNASYTFNSAISALTSGEKIFAKAGTYSIDSLITIDKPIVLEGEGGIYDASTYTVNGTCLQGSVDILKISLTNPTYNIELRNIGFDGVDRTAGTVGIEIDGAHVSFENVAVIRFDEGVKLNNAWSSDFSALQCWRNNVGLNMTGTGTSLLLFQKCQFAVNYNTGVIVRGSHGATFLSCDMSWNKYWGVSINTTDARVINFIGCYFEYNPASDIGGLAGGHVYVGENAWCSVINIEDCVLGQFDTNASITDADRIYIEHGYTINVKGCLFYQPSGETVHTDIDNDQGSGAYLLIDSCKEVHDGNWVIEGHQGISSVNTEGFVTENSGTQICVNNEDIAHGLAGTPTYVDVTPMNDTYDGVAVIATVDWSNVDATNIQVGLYWVNGTAIADDVILVAWTAEYAP